MLSARLEFSVLCSPSSDLWQRHCPWLLFDTDLFPPRAYIWIRTAVSCLRVLPSNDPAIILMGTCMVRALSLHMSNCLVSKKGAIKSQVPQAVPKETTRHQRDCLGEDPCTGTLGLDWGALQCLELGTEGSRHLCMKDTKLISKGFITHGKLGLKKLMKWSHIRDGKKWIFIIFVFKKKWQIMKKFVLAYI